MSLRATPSQTVGPFFDLGLSSLYAEDMAGPDVRGARIAVRGRVLDGDAAPIQDAVLEFWQADADGRYPSLGAATAGFRGFGRVATDAEGRFRVKTIEPGAIDDQAPHLNVQVFMRGLLKPALSRIYLPDHALHAQDPVLRLVPVARWPTLIARRGGDGWLEWDVRMQGEHETVFFDF